MRQWNHFPTAPVHLRQKVEAVSLSDKKPKTNKKNLASFRPQTSFPMLLFLPKRAKPVSSRGAGWTSAPQHDCHRALQASTTHRQSTWTWFFSDRIALIAVCMQLEKILTAGHSGISLPFSHPVESPTGVPPEDTHSAFPALPSLLHILQLPRGSTVSTSPWKPALPSSLAGLPACPAERDSQRFGDREHPGAQPCSSVLGPKWLLRPDAGPQVARWCCQQFVP